jgi:peroxin-3
MKLPIVLATLTRQAHQIGNGVPNEYLQAMEQVGDLEAFAAVVYSSNWETEIMPMSEESVVKDAKEKESNGGSDGAEFVNVGESVVDIGAGSTFENAWGKATESTIKGGVLESS